MKKSMRAVSDFDEAISTLDKLIAKGWATYEVAKRGFEKARDENTLNENVNKLTKQYTSGHYEWYMNVYKAIGELTDRNYYWVLFVNAPPNDGSWIEGLGPHISNYLINFENRIKALTDILIMLEERRGTIIRQEIARHEYDASNRYWLVYDEIAGKLYLNGNILLASTRLDSPADKLLQQVFASPNNLIELKGVTPTQVSSALRDMNIKGPLKKLFFPRTSGKKVLFRPTITNAEFISEEHKDISLAELMRNNEK